MISGEVLKLAKRGFCSFAKARRPGPACLKTVVLTKAYPGLTAQDLSTLVSFAQNNTLWQRRECLRSVRTSFLKRQDDASAPAWFFD